MVPHFFECMGATLFRTETSSVIFTFGPAEKTSAISSDFASKKVRTKNEFGRLLCSASKPNNALVILVLASFVSLDITSSPKRW